VLWILVAKLGRNPQLHRKAVVRRQHLSVVRERQQCLRMERRGPVPTLSLQEVGALAR
jgi:hypothetical protein